MESGTSSPPRRTGPLPMSRFVLPVACTPRSHMVLRIGRRDNARRLYWPGLSARIEEMARVARLLALLMLLGATASVRPAPGTAGQSPVPSQTARPAAVTVKAIFLTGQAAPDGGTFTEFSDPALNVRGDLAFAALTTARAHQAVYLKTGSRTSRLVAAGQPAPGRGTFQLFNDVVLNDRGTVVFLGRVRDRVTRQGLYLVRAGTIVPIAVTGQPGPSGGVFTDFANPTINNEEVVAFVGRMAQGPQEGIFTASEGSIAPAVLSGHPAPTGGTFEFFLDGSPAQNDRGQIAFVASTTNRGTFGVYVLTGSRTVPVATTDDQAPSGGPFTEFGFVMLTNAGTVGFVGRSARSAVRESLYVTGRAVLVPLARQGEAVSGTALTTFVNSEMNGREDVVFELGTPDPIPRAIFLADRAGVRIIVRAGDVAPGGRRFTAFDAPALNDRDEIAFVAETDDGRHGIYVVTPK
jgi:hypothetical protein